MSDSSGEDLFLITRSRLALVQQRGRFFVSEEARRTVDFNVYTVVYFSIGFGILFIVAFIISRTWKKHDRTTLISKETGGQLRQMYSIAGADEKQGGIVESVQEVREERDL